MPRSVAYDVINSTLQSRRPFDEAFNQHIRIDKLSSMDRKLAFNIIITTLRFLGQIDDIISQCLTTNLPHRGRFARTILRIGVCQLINLDIPAHAVVNTSVNLAKQKKQDAYKKLINAILRRVARERGELMKAHDVAKLTTPEWLWNSWLNAYGEETTRKIAESHLKIPPLDLWAKSDANIWAKKLGGQLLPTGGIRLNGSEGLSELEGFKDGSWWVQDAAASLPVQLFGKNLKGKVIADICAAPGGKTAQLIAAGAKVIAIDKSEKRLKKMTENLERLSFFPDVICSDALLWRPQKLLDGVLVDAPCSATGIIRRHPDVKYLKNIKSITQARETQLRLLEAATTMIKSDGQIVFSTCSLQPEEGHNLVNTFLSEHPNWKRKEFQSSDLKNCTEFITSAGDIRTLPFHLSTDRSSINPKKNIPKGGMDGFFSTCLIQK